ncbi:histidine triad (HIT) [Micractinium conductrix]|uniref:Histidine triad (HIT) n=1 Tax=Micractinium conductrix TaxID=554055 RepID=A0A2P6VIC9_9CHLO|nr:histidine triad (HIT) [Micractinium conductrix]|eukprot:PSC73853.1 histidine triad (HIT) [Micractinium conductrix]
MSPSPIIASVCLAAGLALGRLLPRRRVRGEAATEFDMDPRLLQGKHWVCDLPLCRVLWCDDANYPCWLVLVPRVNRVREVLQLSEEQQAAVWREVAAAAAVVRDLYRPFKLNIAAIGNIVSQLHVHVTGRLESDPAWPGPCYGAVPPAPVDPAAVDSVLATLRAAFDRAKL